MPGFLATSFSISIDFTNSSPKILSIDILITKADSINLCTDMFTIIGYTLALMANGNPYLLHLKHIFPEIGSRITLLFIINPNLLQSNYTLI